jgi:hypothetical protein
LGSPCGPFGNHVPSLFSAQGYHLQYPWYDALRTTATGHGSLFGRGRERRGDGLPLAVQTGYFSRRWRCCYLKISLCSSLVLCSC